MHRLLWKSLLSILKTLPAHIPGNPPPPSANGCSLRAVSNTSGLQKLPLSDVMRECLRSCSRRIASSMMTPSNLRNTRWPFHCVATLKTRRPETRALLYALILRFGKALQFPMAWRENRLKGATSNNGWKKVSSPSALGCCRFRVCTGCTRKCFALYDFHNQTPRRSAGFFLAWGKAEGPGCICDTARG